MKKLFCALLLTISLGAKAQTAAKWNSPGAGNPFIPGYFADPTIKKFGDTYYLYATTDGNGNGYGPAQVWMSKDFQNWTNVTMNWPTTEVVWAPDVMKGADGQYHYFYCEPCVLHEGIGQTPRGPWANILGKTDAVLVPDRFVHNAITLDGQTFVDDDGSVYIYFGTWGIYEGFGCGVAKFGADMKSFTDKKLIPNTEVKDFFEAPFVLKKNGIYYFMYSSGSCHDHTYRVQYATSTAGPMGPYEYQGCILETNADETVHGPGHHSVLQDGEDYYIVYHRHNNPKSIHGFHRQICIDKLVFTADGKIEKVEPTHEGLLPKSVSALPRMQNLAFGAKAKASSYYSDWFRPEYATDDNNATLWKPATCTGEDYLEIDLGQPTRFDQVWTQFEYATYFYQYKIEVSDDARQWTLYADKSRNTLAASPYVDRGSQTARYLRITVTGRQKNGHFGGIWNVKVFNGANQVPPQLQVAVEGNGRWQNTAGMLGGSFRPEGDKMVADFDAGFIFAKKQPYSVIYQQGGKTIAYISDGKTQRQYTDGQDNGKSKQKWGSRLAVPGDVSNLRVFTYALEPAEISFYAEHPVEQAAADVDERLKAARREAGNKVIDISANDFTINTTVNSIKNHAGGAFSSENGVRIELKDGRQAFRFTGNQLFRSDFPMPQTLCYSAPYTIAAWILNPQVEKNECIIQLMPTGADLSTVELCNGSDPQNGLVRHNGSFENSGARQIAEQQGQWQHWVITYDGYMERHYLNGRLVSEKNMMLLLRPQRYALIGGTADGSTAFDGYLHTLRVYDRTLSAQEVAAEYQQPTETSVCLQLMPADGLADWHNQGTWGGHAAGAEQVYAGKLALTAPLTLSGMTDNGRAQSLSMAFAVQKGLKKGSLLKVGDTDLSLTPQTISCNGQTVKVKFDKWNLLTLTADNQVWLNGEPIALDCPGLPTGTGSMQIGDHGIAVAQLLISKDRTTEAQAKAEAALLATPPAQQSPTLRAQAITPKLIRLTVETSVPTSGLSYRFSGQGGWQKEPTALIAADTKGRLTFTATVKDAQGNVWESNTVSLQTDQLRFDVIADEFNGTALSPAWKTLSGQKAKDTKATVADGSLTLQSASGNFNAHADENGILVYHEVKGDFVMQGRVADFMGRSRRQTPAYNEGGLMVIDDSQPDNQQIVQLGVFPSYNCGNMLTAVFARGQRPQYPRGNAWNYDPYLQIERQGNLFHARTSKDGEQWEDMPGSPIEWRQGREETPLKVGFFQVTYTDKLGTVSFDDFLLWQRK